MVKTPLPGRIIIKAPKSETPMPMIRFGPIFSFRNKKAPKVINTGLILNKAVASANPNREKAKKNNVVASIKATDLKNCNFGYLVFPYIFIRGSISNVTSTAWTVYLAQIVWTGPISCIKYFAAASIDAKQNIAPIIRKIGKVFGFIRKLY